MEEFNEALSISRATLGEVAEGIGRVRRTVEQYRSGERSVTPDAARAMVAYLRDRSEQFTITASKLEAALNKEKP